MIGGLRDRDPLEMRRVRGERERERVRGSLVMMIGGDLCLSLPKTRRGDVERRLRGHSLEKSPRLRLPPSSRMTGVRRPELGMMTGSVRLGECSERPVRMMGGDLLRDRRVSRIPGERDRDLRDR
jgi:hypothetical protein